MRLLILGGNVFLGRAIARHARDAGHDVTCVARGTSGEPVEGVRFVPADRDRPGGLSGLDGAVFDAAIDVTRRPSHARTAVRDLAGRVGHWGYVSSVSVYADQTTVGQRADVAAVLPPATSDDPDPAPEAYGRQKVACEQAVRDAVGAERAFICRPGLIVGPEDPTGRFTYWVARLARGGRVLAPGDPADPVQLVDVRDLARWLVLAVEQGLAGAFDAVCPPIPRAELLTQVAAGVGVEPTLTWVGQDFLQAHDVQPWSGARSLPLWVPLPELAGLLTRDVSAALAAGLTIRPLAETAAATWEWLATAGEAAALTGLTAPEEAALLRAWDGATG